MIFIVLLTQIQLNRSTLKDPFRFTRRLIDYSRNTTIGIDLQKPWLFLRILADVDLSSIVFDAEFF